MRDYIESIIALLRITWKILPPPSIKPQSTGCQAHMLYYRGATRLITFFGYTGAGVNSRYTKMLILSELIKSQVLKSQKAYPPEWEFKVTSVHYTDLSLWAVLYFIWNSGGTPLTSEHLIKLLVRSDQWWHYNPNIYNLMLLLLGDTTFTRKIIQK